VDASDLPLLNAILNGTAAVLMLAGYRAIRSGRADLHRSLMVTTLAVSVAFLASYLTYHAIHGSTRFQGEGAIRPVYFAILISHTVLAAAVVPLVVTSVTLALRGRLDRHKRWARVTFPIWLYVSVTGVLIYLILYQWFPGKGA
jgi:uncharacterized membrane protein YozB (DUF420 family)